MATITMITSGTTGNSSLEGVVMGHAPQQSGAAARLPAAGQPSASGIRAAHVRAEEHFTQGDDYANDGRRLGKSEARSHLDVHGLKPHLFAEKLETILGIYLGVCCGPSAEWLAN